VDIVVVQVQLEDPDTTWTYESKEVPPSRVVNPHNNEPSPPVNWLKDPNMLHAALPHARIIRFGFRPSISLKASVEYNRFAEILSSELVEKRKKCPSRPLIFIGHGFGGIVVQQTILQKSEEYLEGLVRHVAGIVFMVTPFSELEDLADIIRNQLSKLAKKSIPPANLLDTRSNNQALLQIHSEFLEKVAKANISIFCFTEKKKTKVVNTWQVKVSRIVCFLLFDWS
jgi:hypothetical protein